MLNVWLLGIGIALMNVPFNVAHFLLGFKYNEIANDIPEILDETTDSKPYAEKHKQAYWLLIGLNVGMPIL